MPTPATPYRALQCLFQIVDLLSHPEAELPDLLRSLVVLLPRGVRHGEVAEARISYLMECSQTPGFAETPWSLRSPILVHGDYRGDIEVVYRENRSSRKDNPWHLDDKKLVDLTALKLGTFMEAREAVEEDVLGRQPRMVTDTRAEWRSILDLVAEIDPLLHGRLLRRLMNHLTKIGVPNVQKMVGRLTPALYAAEVYSSGSNMPLPRRDAGEIRRIYHEILTVADITMEDEDLNSRLRKWMRQDKLSYMATAVEKRDIALVEVTELIDRFCRETREGEPSLSPATDRNVRVGLLRRFFTDNLRFIRLGTEHMSIYDFGRLLNQVIGHAQGTGKLGGKAAGLILGAHILKTHAAGHPLVSKVKTPRAWHLTSDGIYNFLRHNSLDDLWSLKFSSLDEIRDNFPYLEQLFKNSSFPFETLHQLQFALDDLGEGPLIVRSSSLLEDSEGSAFSGKYRSLFLANVGPREKRLEALRDAVSEVYASVFGPDPIQYRAERGLLDFMEEMGIIIQKVVGRRVGKYWLPAYAGVAFSHNECRWSPRLRRQDGILRMVMGLGTRAVDRVENDFPTLISPGQPHLRVNATPEAVFHYAQTLIDVINLESGRFETLQLEDLLKEVTDDYPLIEQLVSTYEEGMLRKPLRGMIDFRSDTLLPTFAGLVDQTPFIEQMRAILRVLETAMGLAVDLEFAHDGQDLYLLQCRPQSQMEDAQLVTLPHKVDYDKKLFSASKYVTNGAVQGVRYLVYVDPEGYRSLPSRQDLLDVADTISRLNALLPRRAFILMGPGRWGSRGDLTLGVGITYSGINNTQMLIEIARQKGNYVPDLSFGTHFFQDLVEARIRYLALYPDEEGNLFNEGFFLQSPSVLSELLPDCARLDRVIRVIDVAQIHPGHELHVVMDGEKDRALGYLAPAGEEALER